MWGGVKFVSAEDMGVMGRQRCESCRLGPTGKAAVGPGSRVTAGGKWGSQAGRLTSRSSRKEDPLYRTAHLLTPLYNI